MRIYFLVIILNVLMLPYQLWAKPPAVLLAENYNSSVDVSQYLISEKYDGVRAIWDGKQLITRQGNAINAPAWFTKNLPKIAMDGELWLGRGQFDAL